MIPFSQLQIIMSTSPFWVSILGYFVNGEQVELYEYAAMLLSFFGVVVIALSRTQTNKIESHTIGIIFAIFISGITGLCNVISRKLKDVNYSIVMFYHAIAGIILSVAIMIDYVFI